MKRTLLVSFGLLLAACSSDSIPNVSRVDDNARYYMKKAQESKDAAAGACLRAANDAAGVCAEVLDRLHAQKSVSGWTYRRLTKADTEMQEACLRFR